MDLARIGSIVVLGCAIAIGGAHRAQAKGLTEREVLLLYNHFDAESQAIRDAYVALHPSVVEYDLAIDYGAALHQNLSLPVDPPNELCPTYAGDDAVSRYYVTPNAYQSYVRAPLLAFLAAHPDVIAIATTRGLPAAISTSFTPAATHDTSCMKSSFEAALARIGYPDQGGVGVLLNPYYGKLGEPFRSFLDTPTTACGPGGAENVGKMYLVSRLDGGGNYADSRPHLEVVLDLVQRSASLVVNKRAVTAVFDEFPDDDTYMPGSRAGADYLQDHGWCVFRDATPAFLNGVHQPVDPACGALDPALEGLYQPWPEIVHATPGRNHACTGCEPVCIDYVRWYGAHPAGLFISIESYNGITIRAPDFQAPQWGHGAVLDWIEAGGSFSCGNVNGPSTAETAHAHFVAANLYQIGLSWGESIWTSLRVLGHFQTPIGDPLARVTVLDPDVDGDGDVDAQDAHIVRAAQGTSGPVGDIDHDGIVGDSDMKLVEEALGHDCSAFPHVPDSPFGTPGMPFVNTCGDTNNDLVIDATDLQNVLDNWGSTDCLYVDVNHDGIIGVDDLLTVIANMNRFEPDVNGDCVVNVDDLLLLISVWGTCAGQPGYDPRADTDCSGCIDTSDYLIVVTHWGQHCP